MHRINDHFYFMDNWSKHFPCISIFNSNNELIWVWSNLRSYRDSGEWVALMTRNIAVFLRDMPVKLYSAALVGKVGYDELLEEMLSKPSKLKNEEL